MCKSPLSPAPAQPRPAPRSSGAAQVRQTCPARPGRADIGTHRRCQPSPLRLQPYKRVWDAEQRELGRVFHCPAAMGGGAFILVLAVALAESVGPAERKVWGWVTMGAWQTRHWDTVWAARSSPLSAILGLDKQESFARTKSRQRAKYPWITPTTSRKICSHEGTMQKTFLPLGFVPGSTMPVASPLTSGSVSGCTLHDTGLGHSGLAPPSSQQHPGAAFPQTGIRDSQCPELHSQQGWWLPWCRAGAGMGSLCVRGWRVQGCIPSVPAQRTVEE